MSAAARAGRKRPLTLLIAALGGEGGGLLTDWIVTACEREGVHVQATSIPGVAQRTGATTYYLEMMRPQDGETREPVFALYPAPGRIDLAVASELVEAGRLIEAGYVAPDRTTLVAGSHRIFAIEEKAAMGEGAFETPRIVDAARAFARKAVLHDFAALARSTNSALNAVLLGAIAETGLLPLSADAFEASIAARGVAVEANRAGFRAGRALAAGEIEAPQPAREAEPAPADAPASAAGLAEQMRAFPEAVRDVLEAGVARLVEYQDEAYAALYLERLAPVPALDKGVDAHALTRETARYLALWMAYEDVTRVAQLKSDPARLARIRREAGARDGEPVRISEFLKPGLDEAASLMPAALGARLIALAERHGLAQRLHLPIRLRSDTVTGYLMLRLLARLKGLRPSSARYRREQAMIERWLAAIADAGARSPELAREVAACGRIVKGYSDTRARAMHNLDIILEQVLAPLLAAGRLPKAAAQILREAREAALADEDGRALEELLSAMRDSAAGAGAKGKKRTGSRGRAEPVSAAE